MDRESSTLHTAAWLDTRMYLLARCLFYLCICTYSAFRVSSMYYIYLMSQLNRLPLSRYPISYQYRYQCCTSRQSTARWDRRKNLWFARIYSTSSTLCFMSSLQRVQYVLVS
ncbi:hypothetical protein EX30DRAFT_211383 [Ascodesmis nigricans]|uniref:Uncharacterized protein n=1 Tax=Ascodesmis nigricans TaxID=341454 RepID=A0A4S2MJR7_9PEZI|nr:hypothetical protein EX30DRAFT_211383 [Ascodesmis nigricans]